MKHDCWTESLLSSTRTTIYSVHWGCPGACHRLLGVCWRLELVALASRWFLLVRTPLTLWPRWEGLRVSFETGRSPTIRSILSTKFSTMFSKLTMCEAWVECTTRWRPLLLVTEWRGQWVVRLWRRRKRGHCGSPCPLYTCVCIYVYKVNLI